MVPLKYLSNFWKALEMSLFNSKISLIPTWSANCVIPFIYHSISAIMDAKLYVPVASLSTKEKVELLQQLKSGFKRTIIWNKY